ncbi:hypothetical protein, partial [Pediococcus ethanolidurans]
KNWQAEEAALLSTFHLQRYCTKNFKEALISFTEFDMHEVLENQIFMHILSKDCVNDAGYEEVSLSIGEKYVRNS